MDTVVVKSALISVSDKTGLEDLLAALAARGVALISTGGTYAFIRAAGYEVIEISEYTGSPEMMQGRVKTLHPKVHGGLLGRAGIDNTVMAIRADEKFMMRALCTPQEMILTAPIAGGYLTVVKAAMRPGTFVTDMDAAGVLIQNQVQKVRTATTNEKSTARQELIKIVYDMTGRSIEETRSTEEPRSTEDQPKEYCYFMLRAPGNQTVIVWERLSIQLAAEMSMLQDILGKEPSKITVVPAPFPIGSPKFGPGCAMAEKAEAHLYVDGLGEIEYVAEGGEKIMFTLSLCDAQYSPLLTPLQQEEKDKRDDTNAAKMNRQEEMQTKREEREDRTVMIVGHLPLPCLGHHWLSEPCKPFRTAVNKTIHHMAKVADIPIKDISHCHATSPNIGMLENRVLLWVEVEETFDARALDWNLIKTGHARRSHIWD